MPRLMMSIEAEQPIRVKLDADAKRKLETEGKVRLSEEQMAKIEGICNMFVKLALLECAEPDFRDVEKAVGTVLRTAAELTEAVERISAAPLNHPDNHAVHLIQDRLSLRRKLSEDIPALRDICNAAQTVLSVDLPASAAPTSPGPQRLSSEIRFICDVARVFADAGGKATVGYKENAKKNDPDYGKGSRTSPFVRFLYALTTYLPADLQRPSVKALGEFVHRLRKELKAQAQTLTSNDWF